MRLIGISGKRGAGKDTAAAMVQEMAGPFANWEIAKFADKPKKIVALMTGEPLENMHTQAGKAKYLPDWGLTIGEIQQRFATAGVRDAVHPNAWVIACFSDFKARHDYIITDVRFPNEADAIRDAGGVMIRINGNPAGIQGDGTRDDNHISETALDEYEFDLVVENDRDLAALYHKFYDFLLVRDFI